MSIIGTRVDGRLIHGQVANLWVTKLQISRIMVVDDKTATSQIEKSGLKLATPSGVRLSVLPVQKAATNILAGKYDSQRLLIVVKEPKYLNDLVDAGVELSDVNVGNLARDNAKKILTHQVSVTQDDIDNFKELNQKGVHLFAQVNQSVKSEEFMKLLQN